MPNDTRSDPRPAAVTFATTEHFTLQGARSSTIAESTGRATMFLASVSGGMVALGLIATNARLNVLFLASSVTVVCAAVVAWWLLAHPFRMEGRPQ